MQDNRRQRREPSEPAAQKTRKKKNRGWMIVKKLFSILFSTILSLFLICIITGTIVATAATIYVLDFMEESSTITLEEMKMSYNSNVFAYDKEGKLINLYEVPNEIQRIPVNLDQIQQHTLDAFIYTEDERFYTHDGVDYKNTIGAFMNLVFSFWDTERGGSTITQQLIKNVTKDDDPSPSRKIREIFRAMTLEKNYPKDKIIETYLNYIGFGGPNNGIQMASMEYFGKNVEDLTIAESAVLAAIPQSPETINPFAGYTDDQTGKWVNTGRERNRERMEYVLWQMYDHGAISYDDYQKALSEHIIYADTQEYKDLHPELQAQKSDDEAATSWVVDAAIREVQAYLMETYNLDADDALERFNKGGYQVYTTVDLEMQKYVEEKFLDLNNIVNARSVAKYEDTNKDGVIDDLDKVIYPQVAFIAMDYEGNILSVVGATGKKEDALIWNYATMEPRQPGSTMKPVAGYGYGIYTDKFHWGSMIKDYGITVDGELWPHNYGGDPGTGKEVPMYYGLMRSLNTISARLVDTLTPAEVFNFSREKLGLKLTEIDGHGKTDMALSPLSVGALTYGVTMQNMVNAYIPYGNGGTYYHSRIVSRLEQGNHDLVYENNGDPHEAVDAETAYIMNRMMKNVVSANGTAGAAKLANKEVVGKTGTTQNWDDLWFIGLTEDFVSGAWIGYVQRDTIKANPSSAQIWYNIIGEYANSLDTDAEYPECDTIISAAVCTNSGKIAAAGCPKGETGYWKSSNAPKCSGCVKQETTNPSATTESGASSTTKPSSTTAPNGGGNTPAPTDPPETQAPPPTDPPAPPPTDPPAPPPTDPPAAEDPAVG